MFTDEEIRARIVLKLYRHGKWGASHTSFENLKKGFNLRDLGKDGTKRVDKIGKEMIKAGLIMSHPTGYGLEISLNPRFSQELMTLIKSHFSDVE
ncbi:hypothetical protein NTE_01610 [Candidatus Nitrososphaera evergladensis SR1]|jgi:hypothetical protein|uniref:Transcriptional regulator n=1 Tax=Candidatus Nitrososphaera evergladensis SR1 TaxID=1459636 RepID=A0A075MR45_9ARCH|nr:hypothetical protein [Candidatus Nitrososphaera evergladensis]AIF83673.1 hypothetical protein NTE_01610 [Candidatus Nitrososphaera evergladensis SR1]